MTPAGRDCLQYLASGWLAMGFLGLAALVCIAMVTRLSYALVLVLPVTAVGMLVIAALALLRLYRTRRKGLPAD